MKTNVKHRLLCVVIILLNIFICDARIVTSPVYINSPDSSVYANAITNVIKRKPKIGHAYYWYKMNSILSSDGGFSGRLLHGSYTSYFHNHNLKCQGTFDRGLKQGVWTTWFSNGKVSERTHYSNGLVDGARELYDSLGFLTMRIYYRNGVRAGKTTIFSQVHADSVIRYKKGVAVKPKVKNDSVSTDNKRQRRRVIKTDTCTANSPDSMKAVRSRNFIRSKSKSDKDTATVKPGMKFRYSSIFKRKNKTPDEQSDHE